MSRQQIRAAFVQQVGIEDIFDIYETQGEWTVETEQYTFVYDMEREKFVNVTGY